eukprot:3695304-Heterocapsa_arctica.AAC.1
MADDKVQEPRGVPLPRAPSALEQERHTLMHVPYACWCSTCVTSRGRDNALRPVVPQGMPADGRPGGSADADLGR